MDKNIVFIPVKLRRGENTTTTLLLSYQGDKEYEMIHTGEDFVRIDIYTGYYQSKK